MARQEHVSAGLMSQARHNVREFFYATEVPYGLAMVRMFLPLAIAIPMIHRWSFIRELYSLDGAPAQLSIGYGYGLLFPEFSGTVVVGLYSLMLFSLFTMAIGWNTRISTLLATVLYTYFTFIDCISTVTKYTVIATDAMIVLSMAQSGAVWSVDSWRRRRRTDRTSMLPGTLDDLPRSAVWPRRLLQLLIGCVYFGAASTKIHTPEFFSGDQLRYWMITNVNFGHPLGEYLATTPASLVVCAYVTIIWEILFLFLCWRSWTRPVMLAIGAFFHFMTCLTLGLFIFPLVCTSIYWAFLDERDVQRFSAYLRRCMRIPASRLGRFCQQMHTWRVSITGWKPPVSIPSPIAFSGFAACLMLLGIVTEHQADLYGLRRPDGPLELPKMDRNLALSMIQSRERIRTQDKFHSFELGTTLLSGVLVDHQDQYQHGDTIIAQCSMNPPHEDMWVECNLHDENDRLIDRHGTVVSREMLRANYFYRVGDALVPGQYFLVLRSNGQEIMRRSFQLSRTSGAALAN